MEGVSMWMAAHLWVVVEEEDEVKSVASESVGCWIWSWSDLGVTWCDCEVEMQSSCDEVTEAKWVHVHM